VLLRCSLATYTLPCLFVEPVFVAKSMARDLLKMMLKDDPGSTQKSGLGENLGLKQWARNKDMKVDGPTASHF
jgi:hypothetical protein